MGLLVVNPETNLIPRLSFLPLHSLQLFLIVGAHVAAPTELPTSVLHLAADPESQQHILG